MRRVIPLLLASLVLAACAETPTSTNTDVDAQLAKAPAYPPNAYATFILNGGNPAPDAYGGYSNGVCGVSATIFYGNGGNDAVMRTNSTRPADYSACGGSQRKFTLVHPGGTQLGWQMVIKNAGGVTPGTSATRQLGLWLDGGPCTRIQWPSGTVTRSADGSTYSAVGTNGANCLNSKGTVIASYPTFSVSFTVVERATP